MSVFFWALPPQLARTKGRLGFERDKRDWGGGRSVRGDELVLASLFKSGGVGWAWLFTLFSTTSRHRKRRRKFHANH